MVETAKSKWCNTPPGLRSILPSRFWYVCKQRLLKLGTRPAWVLWHRKLPQLFSIQHDIKRTDVGTERYLNETMFRQLCGLKMVFQQHLREAVVHSVTFCLALGIAEWMVQICTRQTQHSSPANLRPMSHLRQSRVTPCRASQVWQGVSHVASWRVAQSRDSFSEYSAALLYVTLTRVRVARIAGVTSVLATVRLREVLCSWSYNGINSTVVALTA